uniref:Uncharacterized protein n=1 Tax=Clastoptera arizonana TaxID=38151 RepID=A0A1B6E611_9HEMI
MSLFNYVVLVILTISGIKCGVFAPIDFSRLLPRIMNAASNCASHAEHKVTPEFCITQWDGRNNPSDSQFDSCKETMTCAVKKLGLMTDDGEWMLSKVASMKESIRDEEMKQQFEQIYDKCSNVEGRNGEAVVNMMQCLMSNSEKFKENVQELAETLKTNEDGF